MRYGFLDFLQSGYKRAAVFLLIIYFAASAYPPISTIKEISFYLLLTMTVFFIFTHKSDEIDYKFPLRNILNSFVLWGLVSALFSDSIGNGIHDWYKYLLFPVFVIYGVVLFCKEKKALEALVAASVLSLGVVLIGSVIYFYGIKGGDLSSRMNVIKETGISINSVGVVAAVPFFLGLCQFLRANELYKKVIFLLCVAGAFTAMLLSATRGALIGFLLPLPLMFVAIANRKKMIFFLSVLIVFAGFFPVKHLATTENINKKMETFVRPAIWSLYGGVVADNPVTGIGFGMENYTKQLYAKYLSKLSESTKHSESKINFLKRAGFFYTHNMFLDTAVRTGLIGLFLLLSLLLSAFLMLINLFRATNDRSTRVWVAFLASALLSIVVQGIFTDIFLIRHAYIFYMLIAFIIAFYRIEGQRITA